MGFFPTQNAILLDFLFLKKQNFPNFIQKDHHFCQFYNLKILLLFENAIPKFCPESRNEFAVSFHIKKYTRGKEFFE